jgi:MFS transporter, DHA3 family, tetracycline resistance protein
MRRANAALVYYLLSGIMTLANTIMFTVLAVYYVQTVGMSPLQLVLVGTAIELSVLLFEVPTGVVADTYSRRLSIIIGMFILGLSWTLEGLIPLFVAIIVAEIIRGLGETFLSGALDAWLADEAGEDQVGTIYVRSGQINRVVGLVAAGISVALASIALNVPVLVGGGLYILLGILLVVIMPEHGFKPEPRESRSPFRDMAATFRSGARVIRGSRMLTMLLLVSGLVGVASEGFDRLWEAHLLASFAFPRIGQLQPVVWFGIIAVVGNIAGLIVTEIFRPRIERMSRVGTATVRGLLWMNAVAVLSILIFAVAGSFWLALAALIVRGIAWSLSWPLYNAWLVQHTESRSRATALSMISQTNAIGQIAGGPGVGAIGNVSLRLAMLATGVLTSAQVWFFAWARRREEAHAEAAEPSPLAPLP